MNCLVNYSDSSEEEGFELEQGLNTNNRKGSSNNKTDILSYQKNESESRKGDIFELDHFINSESMPINGSAQQKKKEISSCGKDNELNQESGASRKRRKVDSSGRHASGLLKPSTNCETTVKDQLNLPAVIHSMFSDGNGARQWADDPSQHGNRTRSFAHVEGNWATHVFIPVKKDERLVHFVHQLLQLFEPSMRFEIQPEFHISLSRTVAIRHHWIDPLVDSLKEGLSSMHSCIGDLDQIKLYSNDEGTRSFLCIEISKEDTAFTEYVSVVDKCFDGFKLPRYYENPSFHISVAWCLGNVCDMVTEDTRTKAEKLLGSFCASNPELSVAFAQHICCRSGNKSFLIPLIV